MKTSPARLLRRTLEYIKTAYHTHSDGFSKAGANEGLPPLLICFGEGRRAPAAAIFARTGDGLGRDDRSPRIGQRHRARPQPKKTADHLHRWRTKTKNKLAWLVFEASKTLVVVLLMQKDKQERHHKHKTVG